MSHREFMSWCAFNRLSPIGDVRNDYYLASIAAEVRRSLVEKPNQVKNKDFMIFAKPTINEYKLRKLPKEAQAFLEPFKEMM